MLVEAKTPITNAERQTGLDQHPRVGFQILLHAAAAKLRALGDNLTAGRDRQSSSRAEHVFPCGYGLLEYFSVNLAVERIVVADISGIGNTSVAVAELLSQGE